MRRLPASPVAGAFLLLMLGLPGRAAPQNPVDPGGVVTVLVTVPAPDGAPDSVAYRVEPAEGFQLFAPNRGTAAVTDQGVRLPLTLGVSPTVTAGQTEAGRVVVDWPGGAATEPFSVRVRARYRLRFRIGAESITAPPGDPVEFGYYLDNRGNAVDTVAIDVKGPDGWTLRAAPTRVILEPGDTAIGTVQLVPERDARAGRENVIHVATRSGGDRQSLSTEVVVVGETHWFGDLASLPSTVFLGSTSGTEGVGGVAVEAATEIRPDLRMTLDFRHTDQPFASPVLRRALTGPDFRVTLSSPSLRLAAGDVFTRTDLFTGPSVHGSGVDFRWQGSGAGAALVVATPANGLGDEEGHLVRGSGSLNTEIGRFTGIVSSLRRDAPLFDGFSVRAAGVRYQTGTPGSQLAVQAGAMEVATDSGDSRLGPAVEAEYHLRGDRGTLLARLRTVPATVPRMSAYGDEASLSGTVHLVDGLSALAWGFLTRSPLLGVDPPDRSNGAAAGLRFAFPGRGGPQLQLTARARESAAPVRGTRTLRQSLHSTVDVPVGPFVMELDGEYGRTTLADTAPWLPIRTLRAGARWSSGAQWASVGLTRRDPGTTDPSVFADVNGAVGVGPGVVRAGISADLTAGLAGSTSLWSGATVDVTREVAVTVGVDYGPFAIGDPWRFSLGVSRRFAVPLPIRKQPVVHGVVYEDRNGNRVRDPDEPVLDGIKVRFGPLTATTAADGTFDFMDRVRGGLRVEAADLPLGLMVPADVHLPASRFVEVPVVRTAAVDLTLFLDRDSDGQWDDGEDAADGVVVSVVAPNGRTRDVAADARGRARISALSPGDYTLRIHPPATRRTGGPPIERRISVPPGGVVEQTIAVPLRQREIRIPDSQRLDVRSDRQESDDASV